MREETTLDERRQGYKSGACPQCGRELKYLRLAVPRFILCTGCALAAHDEKLRRLARRGV